MENMTEHLKNIKVLDNNDIIKFKNYIWKKYPENTPVKNAKILSDVIHKVIYTNLEGLPEDFKLIIKTATLKNTIGSGKSLITVYDIFNSCLIDENLRGNFKEQFTNWVTLHIKTEIKVEEIDLYLEYGDIKVKKTVDLEENIYAENEENRYVENEKKITDCEVIKEEQDSTRANTIKLKLRICLNHLNFNRYIALIIICVLIIPLYAVSKNLNFNINKDKQKEENHIFQADKSVSISTKYPNAHLPEYMRYKAINEEKLKSFLDKHNSFLSKEPYFSTMISVSKEFNLNPIVLFSITGQEQSFVPKDKDNAAKIANNPFNIYHSWKEYNTNIRDSSSIAARTVINLSQNMPENEDPFLWIGKNYAEDKCWGNGVKSIFKELSSSVN